MNAFNLGDLDAFLKPYSDSVEVYNFPDEFLFKGKEQMRLRYKTIFDSSSDLHCELKNQIVMSKKVINHELISGLPNQRKAEGVVIYRIENGKIQEVYFDHDL